MTSYKTKLKGNKRQSLTPNVYWPSIRRSTGILTETDLFWSSCPSVTHNSILPFYHRLLFPLRFQIFPSCYKTHFAVHILTSHIPAHLMNQLLFFIRPVQMLAFGYEIPIFYLSFSEIVSQHNLSRSLNTLTFGKRKTSLERYLFCNNNKYLCTHGVWTRVGLHVCQPLIHILYLIVVLLGSFLTVICIQLTSRFDFVECWEGLAEGVSSLGKSFE